MTYDSVGELNEGTLGETSLDQRLGDPANQEKQSKKLDRRLSGVG